MATTEDPANCGCPCGSWSISDLAFNLLQDIRLNEQLAAHLADCSESLACGQVPATGLPLLGMSRSTVWRVLQECDLKPHKSVYWLTSHDPDFDVKAQNICNLYLNAQAMLQRGQMVICCDEKTGILIRKRVNPTLPMRRGEGRKREHEYERHAMRHLIASFCVPTGKVVYDLTQTHTNEDFVKHLRHAIEQMPEARRYHWVMDNVSTHWHLNVCQLMAELNGVAFNPKKLKTGKHRRAFLTDLANVHRFHFTPKHGSWLNQVELFFSVLAGKLLKRDDFGNQEQFVERIEEWMEHYNINLAHPYKWTYSGTPLVRQTPFCQTRKQEKHGRACFSPRPKFFERLFFPPRPYSRKVTT
jgi:transposase